MSAAASSGASPRPPPQACNCTKEELRTEYPELKLSANCPECESVGIKVRISFHRSQSMPVTTGSSRSPSELLALTCPSSTLANLNPANDASGQLIRLSVCNPHPEDGSPPIQADGCLMLLDQGSEVDVFLPAYEAWKLKLKPNLLLKPEHVDTVTGSVLVIYFEQILITLKLQDKDGGNVERSIMATPATPVLAYTEFKANAASSSVAHSTQPQHQSASSSSSSSPSTTPSTSSSSSFLTPVKSTPTSDTSSSQDSVTYPLTSVSPLKHEKDGNQEHFVILGLPAIQRLYLVMDVSAKKVYMAKKRRLRIL